MATRDVKCLTCNEVMARLVKPIVTDEDVWMYQHTMECSQGHTNAIELAPVEDPVEQPE